MPNNEPLAERIARFIARLWGEPLPTDSHDLYLVVRDMRDDIASHDDDDIAEAKITGELMNDILDALERIRDFA